MGRLDKFKSAVLHIRNPVVVQLNFKLIRMPSRSEQYGYIIDWNAFIQQFENALTYKQSLFVFASHAEINRLLPTSDVGEEFLAVFLLCIFDNFIGQR